MLHFLKVQIENQQQQHISIMYGPVTELFPINIPTKSQDLKIQSALGPSPLQITFKPIRNHWSHRVNRKSLFHIYYLYINFKCPIIRRLTGDFRFVVMLMLQSVTFIYNFPFNSDKSTMTPHIIATCLVSQLSVYSSLVHPNS